MLTILCCGDRNWTDRACIERRLERLRLLEIVNGELQDITLVHGAARGADSLAGSIGYILGFTIRQFPARWDMYGRAAGPIRNQQMLDEGRPDMVIAFHNDIAHSKGTADMVRRAKAAGIPTEVVTS